ncbi:DciA family protein [uncultured Phascolarctobacterium sp.]|uniref:DciA family protein n=1 Tax=uncultured Phascolarctobacterium sp. TaxID=512296 RepID=UPI002623A9DB|nr:DciA family protein [uncultured Phascolarctobacterium sp.]
MYEDKLVSTDAVIEHLFDPRFNNKLVPLQGKYLYLQHYLMKKWPEICGLNLVGRCCVEKLVGNELHIRTVNSLLANELYMFQDLFLQKVNAYLCGRVIIKKLYFHSGGYYKRQEKQEQQKEAAPVYEYTSCPQCGARMLKGLELCSVCERENKNKLRQQLAELLRIQPWLTFKDCLAYYKCDKILFTAVKDRLKNYYFEKVRSGYASKTESMLAVLFLLEKQPEAITAAMYDNAIAYLRRDQSVLAFGSRLYGKK